MNRTTAKEIIKLLGMEPHPEGGWYVRTLCDNAADPGGRGHSTAIYYLLDVGEVSAWHRLDATEVWHWYAGAPLVLTTSPNGHDASAVRLGPDLLSGERPQVIVPAGHWQTATSLGAWSLVGCTVAPGFTFDCYEMAPPDWRPTPRPSRMS